MLMAALLLVPGSALGQVIPDSQSTMPWLFDGEVNAHVRVGNRLYLGGGFRSISRRSNITGPIAVFSNESAQLVTAAPDIGATQLNKVASDGQGGWIVMSNGRLIRLNRSGVVSDWQHDLAGIFQGFSSVYQTVRSGNTLFLAGRFETSGPKPRRHVAALDLTTGHLLDWNPEVDGVYVESIAVDGNHVYLGGRFTRIGGLPRSSLARVDATTGAVDNWAPSVASPTGDSSVMAIAVSPSTVFIGGQFSTVDGQSAVNFAAVDRSSGALRPGYPRVSGSSVSGIVLAGNRVVFGGHFLWVNGTARSGIAAVDATSGSLLSWQPFVDDRDYVSTMAVTETGIIVGGEFSIGGAIRSLARFRFDTGEYDPTWNPSPGGAVVQIAVDGDDVAVVGHFNTYGAIPASGLVGFNIQTWEPVTTPAVRGVVQALAATESTLFVGGFFYRVDNQPTSHLAAVNVATGDLLTFAPLMSNKVVSLLAEGNSLYAMGLFTRVNNQSRPHLAAFNTTLGTLLPFATPELAEIERTLWWGNQAQLLLTHGRLWVSGPFTNVGGVPRTGLAAFDPVTGALDALDLAPDGSAWLAKDSEWLYLSGQFTRIAGAERAGLARVRADTGALDGWIPPFLSGAGRIVVAPDMIVAVTTSPSAFGVATIRALNRESGAALSWTSPNVSERTLIGLHDEGVLAIEGYAPLKFFARRTGTALRPLQDVGVTVQGNRVFFNVTPAPTGPAPTSYGISVGSAPGRRDLASLQVAPQPSFSAPAAPGRYFLRMAPQLNGVDGPATPEFSIIVGGSGCMQPPASSQLNLVGSLLSWAPVPGATGYELRAALSSGAAPEYNFALSAGTTTFQTQGAPPGTYYINVASLNPCGSSVVSNEVILRVATPVTPAAPTRLDAVVTGSTVALAWSAPAGEISGYVLEAGSASGLSDLVPAQALDTRPLMLAPMVPAGVYYVRVRARRGSLVSPPSNEVVIRVQ
jgi:hypothetical protein